MKINLKQAKLFRKKAAELIKKAEELEAGRVRKITPEGSSGKCIHGEYTNELFNTHDCKTCGAPKVVICSNSKIIGKKRNSNGCTPSRCKYFSIKNQTKN